MRQLFTIILISLLLAACADDPTSPEQQVLNTLAAMETAAQERSMSDFMSHISDNYSDHQGNDKDAIKRILQVLFLRNQNINVFTLIRSVDIQNGLAAVEISAAMASRDVDLNQEANRLKADTQRFSLALSIEGDSWLVQSVSWRSGW